MAVIDHPIINSPFREPTRHFKFDAEGITDEILTGRRPSSHFVPIPRVKKKGKQLQFETEWTKDHIEPNPVVDRIRQRVGAWRQGGYVGVTGTSSRLLAYWTRELRDKPLFFCQIEAVETEAARGAAGCAAQPLRQLPAVLRALAVPCRGPSPRPHASRVCGRLQQHERVEDGLRLRGRLEQAAG